MNRPEFDERPARQLAFELMKLMVDHDELTAQLRRGDAAGQMRFDKLTKALQDFGAEIAAHSHAWGRFAESLGM